MDPHQVTLREPKMTSMGLDATEELLAEGAGLADETKAHFSWSPPGSRSDYAKATPNSMRRESLLTRQLHSEPDHTDDEHAVPSRAFRTQSMWSNPSTTSTAELTSDDGFSVPSPAVSPPLPPTTTRMPVPVLEKSLEHKLQIVAEEDGSVVQPNDTSEKSVEENLGRRRCIKFVCGGKQRAEPAPASTSSTTTAVEPVSPPKRKCMLKFVCPTRTGAEAKSGEQKTRHPSPPPSHVQSMSSPTIKHRGSDSTITHVSPDAVRVMKEEPAGKVGVVQSSKYSRGHRAGSLSSDGGNEATRFHEFATSEEEKDDWVQESTVHRSRLTVNDTLEKENKLRKACAEVEEEVLEEEEEDEQEDLEEELAVTAGSAQVDDNENDDDDESDEGFHSDDEEGFASSDSEDDSDFEWWKPSGRSTAATSVEHLDRLAIVRAQPHIRGSSAGSASSGHVSPLSSKFKTRKTTHRRGRTAALDIKRPNSPGAPDFSDFVCGTLDEDRPLEQAYIEHRNVKQAAKHGFRPQDIDPTFPTSDPEMDEEDDDDVDDVGSDTDEEHIMHGNLQELVGPARARRASSPRPRAQTHATRSPPPPATTRPQSPPPSKKRTSHRSPPPATRRSVAKSPAPRKLFGHSPAKMISPAPTMRMTSPPNSPVDSTIPLPSTPRALAGRPLGGRPLLTHTASLPRGGITLSRLGTLSSGSESDTARTITDIPKRGAIDIVKGLEKKRQRRKEKLYQKACAKAATKAKTSHRCQPGKGAERMREVGLQLQQYHGKAEHILSL